jgi:hypothetical protein
MDQKFAALKSELSIAIERQTTDQFDVWLESMPTGLPDTLKFERSIFSMAYANPEECEAARRPKVRIQLMSPESEIESRGPWFRPSLHKNSCDLTPLDIKTLQKMYLPSFAFKSGSEECEVKLEVGSRGRSVLFIECDEATTFLPNKKQGCELMVTENKKNLSPEEYQQFGW